jgi:hypothetical protein
MLWEWISVQQASRQQRSGSGIFLQGGDADSRWIQSREVTEGDGTKEIILADCFKWSEENKGEWDVILDYT